METTYHLAYTYATNNLATRQEGMHYPSQRRFLKGGISTAGGVCLKISSCKTLEKNTGESENGTLSKA